MVMMVRYLPAGLLGIVVASLLAALMSTIDTHVNLAASYYVNDLHRRFIDRKREPRHYVTVARIASVPFLLIVPPVTRSPSVFSTGTGSPVIMLSSM